MRFDRDTENTEQEKLYYSIGEVSQLLKLPASLIRFWEKEFDNIKPHKNKKGNRFFTKKDIEVLRMIFSLVKEQGFTLEGARQKLKSKPGYKDGKFRLVNTLEKAKIILLELKSSI